MLHITHEGCPLKIGLNIGWSLTRRRFWFRLIWVWLDLPTMEVRETYFRFRPYMQPWLIFDAGKWNAVENYAVIRRLHVLTDETFSDLQSAQKLDGKIEELFCHFGDDLKS